MVEEKSDELGDIIKALENESNASILELTTSEIKRHKNNILQMTQIKGNMLKEYHKKLKNYRYVRGMHDLQFGYYIRWVPLKEGGEITLTRGAYISGIDIVEDDILIQCKTNFNRFFNIKFGNCIIFQKITNQEKLILEILDIVNKEKK